MIVKSAGETDPRSSQATGKDTGTPARTRGLYRSHTVDALLAAPNETRTTLGSNALWQLAVLEMWLQSMEG